MGFITPMVFQVRPGCGRGGASFAKGKFREGGLGRIKPVASRASPTLHASLEDLSLEAVLELLSKSEASGLLVVENEAVVGELLWEKGRLHGVQVVHPGEASGYRALDYLLGLRQGEVYLEPAPAVGPRGDPLDLGFAARRAEVWARASRLPSDWTLTVQPRRDPGPLSPFLRRAWGKPLAVVLLLYKACPGTVASVLSSLAGAGLVDFGPRRSWGVFFSWPRWPRLGRLEGGLRPGGG